MINTKYSYFKWGLKYLLKLCKCSLHYIPPAKLCYVPIEQHDIGWSAGVQMSYIFQLFQNKRNTFLFDILWLAAPHLTSGKNNKAVNGVVDQKIILKNIFIKRCGGSSSLLYIYISSSSLGFFLHSCWGNPSLLVV